MTSAPTPPAVSDSPPDLERGIHYALKAESLQLYSPQSRGAALCWPIFGYFRTVGLAIALLSVFAIVESLHMRRAVANTIYGAIPLGLLAFFVTRRWLRRQTPQRLIPSEISDPTYRLRAVGPFEQLQRLWERMANEEDVFEPHVFRVARARRSGAKDFLAFALVLILIGGAFFAVAWLFHLSAQPLGMVFSWLSIALTFGVWSFLWPTYLRIVPGRLDLLQYSLLGTGKPSVRSIDLRDARILVQIPGAAFIDLPDSSARHIVDVGPLPGHQPLAFERAILTAARSLAPAPVLPDDDLLG